MRAVGSEREALSAAAQPRRSLLADVIVLFVIGGLLVAILNVADEWHAPFQAETRVDLSLWKLPQYTLYSLVRGWVAMGLSLVFAILYGTWTYYDKKAQAVLLPALDILQSIPVLGFMPGLVLALVYLFPRSNFGLELACVLMIFTAQVWNMVFGYYDSLKAVPDELRQLGRICGFGPVQRFWKIELPFAAQGLIYNCMVSMAGGWFFLTINEAFTLGDKNFQLPGLGSYMSTAIARGDLYAQVAAVVAMSLMILATDRLVWWPLVIWSRKFKIEDVASGPLETTVVQRLFGASRLPNVIASLTRLGRMLPERKTPSKRLPLVETAPGKVSKLAPKVLHIGLLAVIFGAGGYGFYRLVFLLADVDLREWLHIFLCTAATFLRVLFTLILSSLWTIPAGFGLA